MKRLEDIMDIMNTIDYGFKDENGFNLLNTDKWDCFSEFYYLLSPDELLNTKCGVCWDQVELERKLFSDSSIECDTYFIFIDDKENLPSHTFLTFFMNDKYYWFEHSWYDQRGIHEYETLNDLFSDVMKKFLKSREDEIKNNYGVYLYKYMMPEFHISCDEFYEYIKGQEKIQI